MGRLVSVHDKDVITSFMMQDPLANVLAVGDLDDFFWPSTVWYGWEEDGQLIDIALVYIGAGLPVLLCFADTQAAHTQAFCAALQTVIPSSVYTHLYPGVDRYFADQFRMVPHGRHHKMSLEHLDWTSDVDIADTKLLTSQDLDALSRLFQASYPGNFFDPRMLETEMYYGVWEGEQLVSVAGIHVYSEAYDVACIGNVTTHPDFRSRGLATKVLARLIIAMQGHIKHITLNVKADNAPAIHTYEKLGFVRIRDYDEYEFYRQV